MAQRVRRRLLLATANTLVELYRMCQRAARLERIPHEFRKDVASEAFLGIVRGMFGSEELQPELPVGVNSSYVRRAVQWRWADHQRRKKPLPVADWIESLSDTNWWTNPEAVATDRRMVERLRLVFQEAVSDQDREILVRTAIDGESVRSVAASMGLSVSAARKRITRLRARLRVYLQEYATSNT